MCRNAYPAILPHKGPRVFHAQVILSHMNAIRPGQARYIGPVVHKQIRALLPRDLRNFDGGSQHLARGQIFGAILQQAHSRFHQLCGNFRRRPLNQPSV